MQCRRLMALVIDKARSQGTGLGTLVQSGHVGRLGEYCEQAAAAGLVSMVTVNTHGHARRVAPPGGKAPRLGTNPLAFGVPHAGAPLDKDEPCRPNVAVLATPEPQKLLDFVRAKRPALLGFHYRSQA